MIETKVHGRPLGDYVVADLKKHHVETFVDANRVERVVKITDARVIRTRQLAEVPCRRTDASVD